MQSRLNIHAQGRPPAVGDQDGEAAGAEPEVVQRADRAGGRHSLCMLWPWHAAERGALQHRAPRQPCQVLQTKSGNPHVSRKNYHYVRC